MVSIKKWTKDSIKAGLEMFFFEFGRYPTAEEIDAYPDLPSSRQIQRNFGGLVNLRGELGLEIADYTVGNHRSKIATMINQRGNTGEREVESELIKLFGEHFVHVEKLIGIGKRRVDFYVYCRKYIFAVDVFHTNNYRG